jgi:hypothetical protein
MWQKFLVVCVLMVSAFAARAGVQSNVPDTKLGGIVPKWVFRTNVTSDSGIVTSHSGAT